MPPLRDAISQPITTLQESFPIPNLCGNRFFCGVSDKRTQEEWLLAQAIISDVGGYQVGTTSPRSRFVDEDMKSTMMKALSNPSLRMILVSCFDRPRAIASLAKELNIPLSTAYNYVHELVEAGLLAIERTVITDEGKRHEMYRSIAREVRITLQPGEAMLEVLPNEDVASKFYRLWSSLRMEA